MFVSQTPPCPVPLGDHGHPQHGRPTPRPARGLGVGDGAVGVEDADPAVRVDNDHVPLEPRRCKLSQGYPFGPSPPLLMKINDNHQHCDTTFRKFSKSPWGVGGQKAIPHGGSNISIIFKVLDDLVHNSLLLRLVRAPTFSGGGAHQEAGDELLRRELHTHLQNIIYDNLL